MRAPRLFPFERVFEGADGVLNLALYLVGRALRLQLGVTDRLADHLFDCEGLTKSAKAFGNPINGSEH